MKAAFFHDTRLYRDAKGQYYSFGFPYALWQNYLKVFDELQVSTRCCPLEMLKKQERAGYVLSSGERVSFLPISAYRSGKDLFRHFSLIQGQVRMALENADCAIIRLNSFIGFVACHEAIRMGKPWMVEMVACPWDALWNRGSIAGKLAAWPVKAVTRHYVKKAPRVLYVTKEFLQRRYPAEGVCAGISDVNLPPADEMALLNRLSCMGGGPGDLLRFGMVGYLNVDFKGYRQAFEALAKIKNQLPPFVLQCVGGGDPARWKTLLKQLDLEKNVEFLGTIPSGAAMFEWMDHLDLYLIPSLQEGLPRALAEAMSRGLPCIGARTGGIPELLPPDFLYPPKNPDALARLILRVSRDRELQKAAARTNFETAKAYSEEVLMEQRLSFWRDFAADAASKKETAR
ncbi:MAG: glycosyltransferase family 4 protein [Clostridiales bacterium]|nr:glycosyltransferase family 4 protein [Clostridiales bacterium]